MEKNQNQNMNNENVIKQPYDKKEYAKKYYQANREKMISKTRDAYFKMKDNNKNKNKIGKIYMIRSNKTDNIYIGSTFRSLRLRLINHKSDYRSKRNKSSGEIIKYDDHWIEIVEEHINITKKDLNIIEGIYISNCYNAINYRIAGNSKKEYAKKYYEANKDKMKSQTRKAYIKMENSEIKRNKILNKLNTNGFKRIPLKILAKHNIVFSEEQKKYI